jgi:hypothetical protein
MELIDLPVAVGSSAFDCTGDLEPTFFVESLGELPMIEVGSRVCGGVTGVVKSTVSWLTQDDDGF